MIGGTRFAASLGDSHADADRVRAPFACGCDAARVGAAKGIAVPNGDAAYQVKHSHGNDVRGDKQSRGSGV